MTSTEPTRQTARRTRANGRASREAILEAAVSVYAERGYAGTTLAEVARRVGMTQPGLLHHFGSKDALLLEVITSRAARQRESFDTVVRAGGDVIAGLLDTMARENAGSRLHQQLFARLSVEAIQPDHPAHGFFVQRYRQLTAELARHLSVRYGFPEDDAAHVAREVLGALDGLHQQWLLDPEAVDLATVLGAYGRHLSSWLHLRAEEARS